jgi:hypothetical protein
MKKKCLNCRLVNFAEANICARCGSRLGETENIASNGGFLKSPLVKRGGVLLLVCVITVAGFYTSLLFSADSLSYDERSAVNDAIELLKEKGFNDEVFYLEKLAVFRSNDNWLNASVPKERAYAATNFPFEIITLYPEFFLYPADRTEHAAILLHEARHLQGKDEHDAYDYVWKHRQQLGWTRDKYKASDVWNAVKRQTQEMVPEMFVCETKPGFDCTE